MSITEDSINMVTIEEALSMVNNCQTNEACESALSSLPYVQGEIRENAMESLKNDFEFVRERIWLATTMQASPVQQAITDYKDYACRLQNEKKQQDLDGLGQLAWQVWSRVVLEAKDLWVFWRTVVLPKLASFWREVIGMVTAPRPENENSPDISVALKEFLTNEYLTDFFSLENSRKVLSIVGPDANAFALRRYNECTCSKFKLSVEVKSPGDKATILADILQEVRKRAQEQESSDHVEPSVATPGEIMDYQESDDDVAMNEIQKGLMKNKYVILIMDLNEEGTWKDIEGALPDNNFRSRVIITTRRWEVAQICSSGESDMIYRPLVGQERAVEVENVKSFSHGSIASVMGIGKDEWVKKELPDKIAGLSKQALQEWVSGKVQVVEPCNDFFSLKLKVSGADFKHPPPCAWDPNMQMQFLGRVAVLDIRVCQLQDDHLKKLGEMSVLHTLALALAGVQKQKMTITSGSFQKLEVFELDSHVPWVTFQDGAMPELMRLCLKLYAGPKGKTPSGTNHLNKLHEVTLEYSEEYEDCACVKETAAAMKKESCMRRRPSAIIIGGKVTFPRIQVSDCMNANLAKQVRVVMLFLFDYVFAMHLPGAGKIRPRLAKMPRWQLSVAIPFLVLLSYYKLIMLLRTKPLVLLVATWLANRVLPIIVLLPLHEQIQKVNPRWTIITSVVIGYKIACILFPIARLCYKAHQLCTTTRDWFFWELPPLVLVYILRAVWHRLPTLILVFPIVLLIILFHRLAAMSRKFMSLPFLALYIYFLPSFSYSVISGILLNVGPLTKWLIWGWGA